MKTMAMILKPPSKKDRRKMSVDEIANALDLTPAEAARVACAMEELMAASEMEDEEDEAPKAPAKKKSVADVMKGR